MRGSGFSWGDRYGNPDNPPVRCERVYRPGRSCTYFAQFYPEHNGTSRGAYTIAASSGDRVVKVSGRGWGFAEGPTSFTTPGDAGPGIVSEG